MKKRLTLFLNTYYWTSEILRCGAPLLLQKWWKSSLRELNHAQFNKSHYRHLKPVSTLWTRRRRLLDCVITLDQTPTSTQYGDDTDTTHLNSLVLFHDVRRAVRASPWQSWQCVNAGVQCGIMGRSNSGANRPGMNDVLNHEPICRLFVRCVCRCASMGVLLGRRVASRPESVRETRQSKHICAGNYADGVTCWRSATEVCFRVFVVVGGLRVV